MRTFRIFILTTAAIFGFCCIVAGTSPAQHVRPDARLQIGAQAPDFSLPGVDGKTYTLQSFAGSNLLVIIFTANHCPTAQAYETRIQRLYDDYRNKGVAFAVVSPNDPNALRLDEMGYTDVGDTFAEMKIRGKDLHFTFPYLYDGDTQAMSHEYGPVSTPHVFIFDQSRKLRYAGRIDDNDNPAKVKSRDTRNALDALLAGKPVPVETTKTFGCSIKWAEKRSGVQEAVDRWSTEPVTLERIDEKAIQTLMSNNTDKLRLINVWATWCGPCVTEFPELIAMYHMYRKRPFELVTISADQPDQPDQALAFLKEHQASCTNYLFHTDDKYALIDAVDEEWPGPLPYTLLVEPGGKIIYRHLGEIDPLQVKKIIADWVGRTYFATPGGK